MEEDQLLLKEEVQKWGGGDFYHNSFCSVSLLRQRISQEKKHRFRFRDKFRSRVWGTSYVTKSPDKDGKTNTSVCLSYTAVLIKQGEQETVSEIFGEYSSKTSKNRKEK